MVLVFYIFSLSDILIRPLQNWFSHLMSSFCEHQHCVKPFCKGIVVLKWNRRWLKADEQINHIRWICEWMAREDTMSQLLLMFNRWCSLKSCSLVFSINFHVLSYNLILTTTLLRTIWEMRGGILLLWYSFSSTKKILCLWQSIFPHLHILHLLSCDSCKGGGSIESSRALFLVYQHNFSQLILHSKRTWSTG